MKKNSDVKVMLKETAILFVITLLAGLMLGFVYELTKDPIANQQKKAVQEACMAVFPESGGQEITFEEMEFVLPENLQNSLNETGVTIDNIYGAMGQDKTVLGMVVQATSTEGYGGNIVVCVGVAVDGTVNGVSILEISETPGLGMKAGSVLVPQFANKQVEQFSYTKNGSQSDSEIDAISGATITTKAVTNAVNGALEVARVLAPTK